MPPRATDWPTPEEKLAALHHKLIAAVEELTTSSAWLRMLQVAARFPDYSSGGVGIFQAQEYRPATRLLLCHGVGLAERLQGGDASLISTANPLAAHTAPKSPRPGHRRPQHRHGRLHTSSAATGTPNPQPAMSR